MVEEVDVWVLGPSVSIQFSEPNGTYFYSIGSITGYGVEPQSGSLVVNGSSLTQSVAFSAVAGYEVTFSQTGLRAGVAWSVTLGPRTQTSTSSTITFTEINGSYSYKISNNSKKTVVPDSCYSPLHWYHLYCRPNYAFVSSKIQRFAEIPTRDQTILIGDLYFPDTAPPFPAIVFRTPYGRQYKWYQWRGEKQK